MRLSFFAASGLAALLLAPLAHADGPACTAFERQKACCPHKPPVCCEAAMSAPVDDAAVASICGGKQPRGEASAFQSCKRYYTTGEVTSQVIFGRQPGDDAAFAKLRAGMADGRAQVSDLQLSGASHAFLVRDLDDDGHLESASAWARVGAEIVHVDAERMVCDDKQVVALLAHAIERLQPRRTQAALPRNPG